MSRQIDMDALSRELVRAVRGARSQGALSEQLGFGSNVLYMWESGRRAPEISRFLLMAELAGKQFSVAKFLTDAPASLCQARLSTPRGVQQLVLELVGTVTRTEIAARLQVDRTTLARWLDGKTEPRLPDFLRLVEVTTQRLLTFVEFFFDPAKLDSTRNVHDDLEAQQRLAYEFPWSHAVLRALELRAYQALPEHCDSFLASRLGLCEKEVSHDLQELLQAGQITWTGSHYSVSRVLTVDTREDKARDLALKRHFAEAGLTRLIAQQSPADALFSYNLFAVSHEGFAKIRKLHLEYYEAVRSIVGDSQEADRVVLMNLQLVPLEGEHLSE